MALKLQPPLIREFILSDADRASGLEVDGEPTKVSIRLANQGEVEKRDQTLTSYRRQYDGQTVTVSQEVFYDEVERLEVELTLAACNILDEDGKPLFAFKHDRVESHDKFVAAWNKLPPAYAAAIKEAVKTQNDNWGPLGSS